MDKYYVVGNEIKPGTKFYSVVYANSVKDAVKLGKRELGVDSINAYNERTWYSKYKDLSDHFKKITL